MVATKKKSSLRIYKSRRIFSKTPEPEKTTCTTKNHHIFVIQKHDASHLHYDVRLQIGGVLKSWAVPKGPPTTLGQKRLAVETEDHPLAYATFAGTIPEGNYGAGTVKIWDHGTYYSLKEHSSLKESYKDGHIEVWLEGKRLHGPYALIKTHMRENSWLLLKMRKRK